MFDGDAKFSTDHFKCSNEVLNIPQEREMGVKCSTEVLNIPRTMPNVPRRCYIFHGQCQRFHLGAKYSTDNAKCCTEVLNIPRRGSNVPRRC